MSCPGDLSGFKVEEVLSRTSDTSSGPVSGPIDPHLLRVMPQSQSWVDLDLSTATAASSGAPRAAHPMFWKVSGFQRHDIAAAWADESVDRFHHVSGKVLRVS